MSHSYFDGYHHSMEPLLALQELTTNFYTQMTRHHLQAVNELMQAQAKHLSALSAVKGVNELINEQLNWTQETVANVFQQAHARLDALQEGACHYRHWFEKNCRTKQCDKTAKKNP